MGDRQNIIYDNDYDRMYQIVQQIHDDSPVLTEKLTDFYVRRIATCLGLTIEKYWTPEGDATSALDASVEGLGKD